MSESDDTDLLLLIPPDFFVVHTSDSEDSITSTRRHQERSRVDELVSQVNLLQERVNLIESKDNLTSEKSFSESSRFNQSLDYSVSLDSSNYNCGRKDLALRFYSMSSAGFRFGGRNDHPVDVQCSESHVPSINVTTNSSVLPPSRADIGSEFSSLKSPTFQTPATQNAIEVQPTEMSYSKAPNQPKYMTLDDLGSHTRISQQQQWKDCSFLSEIDEFLENKSRQSLEQVDILPAEGGSHDQNKEREERANNNSPPESVLYASNQDFDLEHVDKLLQQMEATHLEIERRLQSRERDAIQQASAVYADEAADEMSASAKKNFTDVQEFVSQTLFATQNLQGSEDRNLPQTSSSVNLSFNSLPGQQFDKESADNMSRLFDSSEFTKDIQSEENRSFENVNTVNIFTRSGNFCGDWLSKIQQPLVQSETVHPTASGDNKRSHDYMETLKNQELKNGHTQNTDSINMASVSARTQGGVNDPNSRKTSETTQSVNGSKYGTEQETSNPDRFQPLKEDLSSRPSRLPAASLSSDTAFDPELRELPHSIYNQRHRDYGRTHFSRSAPAVQCSESAFAPGSEPLAHPGESHIKKRVEFTAGGRKPETTENLSDGTNKPTMRPPTDEGYFSSTGAGSSTTNLLSLSELWGSQSRITQGRENMTLEQKLEEERYRRKHCEGLIQKLQCKLLEEQQKLAVAVKVDQAKDKAIHQLHTAWKRLSLHWQELEEQRNILSIHLSEEKEKHQQDLTEMSQKIKRYEVELSKILDLAQGYKEKSDIMEQTMRDLESRHIVQLQEMEARLQESEQRLVEAGQDVGEMRREVECTREKLHALEEKLKEEHNSLLKVQQESKKLKRDIEKLEADIAALKEENSNVQLRLKEEKSKSSLLEQNKNHLQIALDESKKKEKSLREELREKASVLERAKVELRDYYQQQVEQVVREKLREFQAQLDAAETSLHQEMEEKERAAIEAASKQIQLLTEKNQLEVKLLEEKHREELQLYKLQLTQATQQIGQLQMQLQSYSHRKVEIVEKLHTVMETQWQEALRIISGNSPIVLPSQEQTRLHLPGNKECKGSQANELNCPASSEQNKSETHNKHAHGNVKTALNIPPVKLPANWPPSSSEVTIPVRDNHNRHGNGIHISHMPQSSTSSSTADEMPFSREGQVTYRANHEAQSNKVESALENNNNTLQKYIEMLLNRAPGDPVGGETAEDHNAPYGETPVSDRRNLPKWEKIILQNGRQLNLSEDPVKSCNISKESQLNKPPWK